MLFRLIRPMLFRMDPEMAHGLALAMLRRLPRATGIAGADPMLAQRMWDLDFATPVGVAPGFDKNAEVFDRMGRFGFSFAEVGTLTPRPQDGNPRPRLFRLAQDRAVINRMGFNNRGQADAAQRLYERGPGPVVLGINIGANKDSVDRIADYVAGVRAMAPLADYLTVNISSPNTPGLRALQDRAALEDLLAAVMAERGHGGPPIWLKVAPDLTEQDVADIAEVVMANGLDALAVSNTTIARPDHLRSAQRDEAGGLSGAPLRDAALARLRDFRVATAGRIPLIGVGGIASAEHAYARIRAGASLIQLYSAMVYEGPGLAARINRGLVALLRRDGLSLISQAVGLDVPLS